MADTRYTAKIRAKRIELEYFKHLHPFRRWKLILSIVLPLLAGVWLIAYAARDDQRIYTSGPLSTAHAMFETSCADCHKPVGAANDPNAQKRAFFLPVEDKTCLICHDGPEHHPNQVLAGKPSGPTCAECHIEHKGHTELARLADNICTQCHADLKTKDGKAPAFAKNVTHFGTNHPEFSVNVRDDKGAVVKRVSLDKRAEAKDNAAIKLNHLLHLKPGLQGMDKVQKPGVKGVTKSADGKPQLACGFCHQLDDSRKSMLPVSFAKHCADCHPLDVPNVDTPAPHDKPQIVHAFMRTSFIETYENCKAGTDPKIKQQCEDMGLAAAPAGGGGGKGEEAPAEGGRGRGRLRGASLVPDFLRKLIALRGDDVVQVQARGGRRGGEEAEAPKEEGGGGGGGGRRGRLRGGDEAEAPAAGGGGGGGAGAALAWAGEQMGANEKLMFKQKCALCHVPTEATKDKIPQQYVETRIPARWLPHSTFDHGAHRPIGCVECHAGAPQSKETTDVLLPQVKVCRDCHRDNGGARAGCVECHVFHDKTKERDPNGPLTVQQLSKRQSASAGSAGKR